MNVWIATDSDRCILGVFETRQDAVDMAELDWVASGAKRGDYAWDGNSLMNVPYATAVRWVTEHEVQS